jgi:hypothetical protein
MLSVARTKAALTKGIKTNEKRNKKKGGAETAVYMPVYVRVYEITAGTRC